MLPASVQAGLAFAKTLLAVLVRGLRLIGIAQTPALTNWAKIVSPWRAVEVGQFEH